MIDLVLTLAVLSPGPTLPPGTSPPAVQSDRKQEVLAEFEKRVAQAGDDVDKLFATALWAQRKGLQLQARRLMRRILKLDPDHEGARKTLGYVQHRGKWVREKELKAILAREERERKRREEAEYRKKGYVKYEGVWVKKEELAYARLGLVKAGERWLRLEDKRMLDAGKVQHPETGVWIDRSDLEKARKGLFPLDGDWAPREQADRYHSTWDSPWRILTDNVEIRTVYPLKTALQIANEAETALSYARQILYDPSLPLPKRVRIFALESVEAYREFGARFDRTGYSAYGCFYAFEHDDQPVAVNYAQKDWGPYYLKHAAGLGAAALLMTPQGVPPTHWLLTGVGSYVERWSNATAAAHFGKQYLAKGGVRSMKSFFKGFAISGDLSPADLEWTIYQAGIFVSYIANKPDKRCLQAWERIREAIREGKGLPKAIALFERSLLAAQDRIRKHLQALVQGG